MKKININRFKIQLKKYEKLISVYSARYFVGTSSNFSTLFLRIRRTYIQSYTGAGMVWVLTLKDNKKELLFFISCPSASLKLAADRDWRFQNVQTVSCFTSDQSKQQRKRQIRWKCTTLLFMIHRVRGAVYLGTDKVQINFSPFPACTAY